MMPSKTMGEIVRLDQHTINRIAAGEVIERPASVVKELIENSIDAGASKIEVAVEDAGKDSIRVSDNGKGMTPEDANICLEKHTTSKLRDSNDLFSISTLGFRGEALSSIASISMLTLSTSNTDGLGTHIETDQGKIQSVTPKAMNKGTTVIVKDLFYNTPVRKKYLKESPTEFRKIISVITRYALAFPEKHFILKHNNNIILDAPPNDEHNNITEILGTEIASQLIQIKLEKDGIAIEGYISKPSLSRGDKSQLITFVNKRCVENDELKDIILQAYHTLLNTQRYPIAILNFTLPHNMIDVNVHPTKREIRFRNLELIAPHITEEIRMKIYGENLVPKITEKNISQRLFWQKRAQEKNSRHKPRDLTPSRQNRLVEIHPLKIDLEKDSNTSKKSQKNFHILGKIHKTFIVEETETGLRLIDQHAAHERVLYEQVIQRYKDAKVSPQVLLQPIPFDVTHEESSLIIEHIETLKELGFEIEQFGPKSYILRSIPNIIGKQLNKDFLFSILADLNTIHKNASLTDKKHAWWARMACRAAEKAGDNLEDLEMQTLLNQLHACDQPHTCPHGRPTMIDFSIHDLEKFFKRVR